MKQKIETKNVIIELPLVMLADKDANQAKSWPEQPGIYLGKDSNGVVCICEIQEGSELVNPIWLPALLFEVINNSITEARLVDRIQNEIEKILTKTTDCVNDAKEYIIRYMICDCETNEIRHDLIKKKLSDIEEKVNCESANKDNTAKGGVSEQCLLDIIRTVTK